MFRNSLELDIAKVNLRMLLKSVLPTAPTVSINVRNKEREKKNIYKYIFKASLKKTCLRY